MHLVVDESLSELELQRVLSHLECVDGVTRVPQGASDQHIFNYLLNESTILATRDRPFHNGVLAGGLKSLFVAQNHITGKPLRGIRPSTLLDHDIPSQGPPPQADLRHYLMPQARAQLKRLTTKRRRIRNHFGGFEALEQNAVTVGYCKTRRGTLIGLRLRVSSKVGKKALDASESYLLEPSGQPALKAYCHALILPIQLMLNSLKTVVYVDGPGREQLETLPFLRRLEACYPNLEYVVSTKGKWVERLRRKLHSLKSEKNNEIRDGALAHLQRQAEPRPGAYAVVTREGRVAVARSGCGYLMLPGGGLEARESAEAALEREVEEECGFKIEVRDFLFEAEEHVELSDHSRLFKHSRFYRARWLSEAPGTPEFEVLWMEPQEAHQLLCEESQARAVLLAGESAAVTNITQ